MPSLMNRINRPFLALAAIAALAIGGSPALAYHGGGGFRGGGFGGFRGGGFGGGFRPSMPSYRPSYGGMSGFRPSYGGYRPNYGGMSGYRPNYGGGMARPNFNPSTMRPHTGNYGGNFNHYNPYNGGVGNRTNIGNTNIGNRANIGNNTNIGNRTNNIGNRVNNNINTGNIGNRTNINTGNIGNRNVNVNNRNINVNNNRNLINTYPGRHPGWDGGWGYFGGRNGWRPGSGNWGYHNGWVHGYWHGRWDQAARDWNHWGWGWNNWGGFYGGLAFGSMLGWAYGPSIWSWGYMPYANPYYVSVPTPVVVNQPVEVPVPVSTFDYSQPINADGAAPDESVANPALDKFTEARTAFKSGDYSKALSLTDEVLKTLKDDPEIHQFRAQTLFALGKYQEAAAALYAVLSVGPGWDWTTLISLYPGVETYTKQLRALEEYRRENPKAGDAAFVLAYQYLCAGHSDAAAKQFEAASKLQPGDTLSASLAKHLTTPPPSGSSTAAAGGDAAAKPPAGSTAAEPEKPAVEVKADALAGTWTAHPTKDTAITLTFGPGEAFQWKVDQKGKAQTIAGQFGTAGDLLTLESSTGPALVGHVTPPGPDGFHFTLVGGPPSDKGLAFAKQ